MNDVLGTTPLSSIRVPLSRRMLNRRKRQENPVAMTLAHMIKGREGSFEYQFNNTAAKVVRRDNTLEVYSYNTRIFILDLDQGILLSNNLTYSSTTSRHESRLGSMLRNAVSLQADSALSLWADVDSVYGSWRVSFIKDSPVSRSDTLMLAETPNGGYRPILRKSVRDKLFLAREGYMSSPSGTLLIPRSRLPWPEGTDYSRPHFERYEDCLTFNVGHHYKPPFGDYMRITPLRWERLMRSLSVEETVGLLAAGWRDNLSRDSALRRYEEVLRIVPLMDMGMSFESAREVYRKAVRIG